MNSDTASGKENLEHNIRNRDNVIERKLNVLLNARIFRPKYSSAIAATARKKMTTFNALKSIDDYTRAQLITYVRHCQVRLASMRNLEKIISNVVTYLAAISLALLFLLGPFGAAQRLSYDIHGWITAVLMVAYFATFLIAYYVLLIFPILQLKNPKLQWAWIIFLMSLLSYGYRSILSPSANHQSFIFVILLANILSLAYAVIAVFFVCTPILTLAQIVIKRLKFSNLSDAVIVDGLIDMLSTVEKSPHSWTDLKFKKKLLSQLEEVAYAIQIYLPRQLRTSDPSNDKWCDDTFKQIAAVLRAQKKWILTPKQDTYEHFLESISNKLIYIAS